MDVELALDRVGYRRRELYKRWHRDRRRFQPPVRDMSAQRRLRWCSRLPHRVVRLLAAGGLGGMPLVAQGHPADDLHLHHIQPLLRNRLMPRRRGVHAVRRPVPGAALRGALLEHVVQRDKGLRRRHSPRAGTPRATGRIPETMHRSQHPCAGRTVRARSCARPAAPASSDRAAPRNRPRSSSPPRRRDSFRWCATRR